MFLTAQRVRSARQECGINVYGYSHRAERTSAIDWHSPDVALVAEGLPGRLMFSVRSVEGTGNLILSCLDVAIADEIPARIVATLLHGALATWSSGLSVWTYGPMSLRFYTALGDEAATELRSLKDELALAVAGVASMSQGDTPFPAHATG